MGKGTNLLNIKAISGMYSDEIQIMDYWYNGTSTYSSDTNLDISLPSTFRIEYEEYISQLSSNSCNLRIGENSTSRYIIIGKVSSSDTKYKIYVRTNSSGSGDLITEGSAIQTSNDWQSMFISYNGTELNFNNDITITNINGVSLNKLLSFNTWKDQTTSGKAKNIKIIKL